MEIPDTFMRLSMDQVRIVLIVVVGVVALLIITRMAFIMASVRLGKSWRATRDYRLAFLAGWAGARGPVSGMAALSIPFTLEDGSSFAYRDTLLATTFGVILVTMLLAQTLGPMARWMKVEPDDEQETVSRINAALAHAALKQLEEAEQQAAMEGHPIQDEVIGPLQAQVASRLDALRASAPAGPDGQVGTTDAIEIRRTSIELEMLMVRAEQEELVRMRDEEGIPDAIVRPILTTLDASLQALSAGRLS